MSNNVSSLTPKTDFGTAWSCVTDLTMPSVMVKGNRIVAEAIARRLITPRGGLVDDPDYGFDLSEFVNADLTPGDIARIQAGVQAECLKDQRVSGASSTVVVANGVLIATIVLTTASGPFTLVLSVSDVTAQLLQVAP